MTHELCPECDCDIGCVGYEKDGVMLCCEACVDGKCGCGC